MFSLPVALKGSRSSLIGPRLRNNDSENRTKSDALLMESFASGDEAGFVAFYERFSTVLFSMTCRILGDRAEAEDSLREAFVQMRKKSSTFDPARGGLFTWAVMITRCGAIDRLRQRQRLPRKKEATREESGGSQLTGEARSGRDATQQDECLKVEPALESITREQREALELAFFSGMTPPEISHALGVPLGTVKARMGRGLIGLRRKLNPPQSAESIRTGLRHPQVT